MENKLTWNVYKENFNKNCIEIYNIFDHVSFRSECEQELGKLFKVTDLTSDIWSESLIQFKDKVEGLLLYYFWGKVEYEIILSDNPQKDNFNSMKVSIYNQVMLNFDAFIDDIITQYTVILSEPIFSN